MHQRIGAQRISEDLPQLMKDGGSEQTAPIARALMGRRKGEEAEFPLGAGVQRLVVTAVAYA